MDPHLAKSSHPVQTEAVEKASREANSRWDLKGEIYWFRIHWLTFLHYL